MGDRLSWHRLRDILCVAAAVALGAWASLVMARHVQGIVAIWLPAGVTLGVLLAAPCRRGPEIAIASCIGATAGAIAAGISLPAALVIAAVGAIEALVIAGLIERRFSASGRVDISRDLPQMIGVAAGVSAITFAPAMTGLAIALHMPAVAGMFWRALLADTLGIGLAMPLVWAVLRGRVGEPFARGRRHLSAAAFLTFFAAVCGVFAQTRYPLLFVLPPALMLVTVVLGFAGVVLAMPTVATIGFVATLAGYGPVCLARDVPLAERVALLQLMLLAFVTMDSYLAEVLQARRQIAAGLETERERLARSERALANSEARFRFLADNAADMLFRIGSDGLILYASESVREVLGWSPADMIGRSVRDFSRPEDSPMRWTEARRADWAGSPVTDQLRALRRDGSLIWVERRTRAVTEGGTTSFISNIRDISQRRAAEEALAAATAELARLATIDALTGLANRRRLDEAVGQEWRRAARERHALTLLLLDVDRFKAFNDLYGHQAGDACLRRIAGVVAGFARREGDLAARFGGEEMLLLLPATDAAGADEVAEEVRAAVASLAVPHAGNAACGGIVTVSIGVATCLPASEEDPPGSVGLIQTADRMLYEAKRISRNTVVSHARLIGTAAVTVMADEAARLAAVEQVTARILDTSHDELDRIARLAAGLLGAGMGIISLVGRDTQVFVGRSGVALEGTDRSLSFCARTILGTEPFVVPDTRADPRFLNNALVTGEPHIRFYAGAPLIDRESGHHLGALCVLDRAPRDMLNAGQLAVLVDLAALAARQLEASLREAPTTLAVPIA